MTALGDNYVRAQIYISFSVVLERFKRRREDRSCHWAVSLIVRGWTPENNLVGNQIIGNNNVSSLKTMPVENMTFAGIPQIEKI